MSDEDPRSIEVPPLRRSLRGRRGESRHTVKRDQRTRLMHAMLVVASEHGYEGANIERVLEQAVMSRRTVYDLFPNRERLFEAVLEAACARLCDTARRGYDDAGIRGAVVATLELFEAEPHLARVCVIEAFGVSPAFRDVSRSALGPLTEMVAAMEQDSRRPATAWPLPAAGVLGGSRELVHRWLETAEKPPGATPELAGQVTYLLVSPYLGARIAATEARAAERAMEAVRRRGEEAHVPPPELDGIALTDLQRRCLAHVARNPGASSRAVADAADIAHDAQSSRLMRVLRDRGLAVSERRGTAHAWSATPLGEAALAALERTGEPEWLA